jgi:hypothetical protein
MPGKQAKVLTPQMVRRMLRRTSSAPFPARDRVMILLSVKAGLRACEIAGLEWSMVLDARGKIADILAIHDAIAKKRGGRRIGPVHRAGDRLPCAVQIGAGREADEQQVTSLDYLARLSNQVRRVGLWPRVRPAQS